MPGVCFHSRPPDLNGRFENHAHRDQTSELVSADRGQAHRCHASTGRAVGVPAELARRDFGLEVRGQRFGGLRKNTIGRGSRRR